MSDQDRFLLHVDRRGDDECWPWTGARDAIWEYGQFRLAGRLIGAHRAAYVLFVGPIPEGHEIDHVLESGCVRRDCVNWVRHLEPVTPRENKRRRRKPKLSVPGSTLSA